MVSSVYRYGFNGKENDNEIKGEGNQQDYGMRVYDPRIGKFLSVDPLSPKYSELTPYQFASNSPIQAVDLDGLEILKVNSSAYRMKYYGTIPLLNKSTAEIIQINSVSIIKENLPKGYEYPPNVTVGTNGQDYIYRINGSADAKSMEPYKGTDDPDVSVQKRLGEIPERAVRGDDSRSSKRFV